MSSERASDVPEDAPEHCPGTSSELAGKAASCAGCPNQAACASAPKGPDPDLVAIQQRLKGVKHRLLVLSGKGGVGKSTFSTQLAFALASRGFEVGLLDIDICGPSIPKMLNLEGSEIHQSNAGWSPVYVTDNLGVMSIGFMLPNPDDAVIWRGPRKNGLIKQFLRDVDWGELDFLVVDSPPGTSDEHITIAQFLEADGAVIVTTPQDVSVIDVRKEVSFCRKVNLPVVGVVENMSGLVQRAPAFKFTKGVGPDAEDVTEKVREALRQLLGELEDVVVQTDVFQVGAAGTAKLCADFKLDLLGRVPLDPELGKAAERGVSAFDGAEQMLAAPGLQSVVTKILEKMGSPQTGGEEKGGGNGHVAGVV